MKSTGITFALNDPGMGEYERAGLAGLYMSLTAAEAWAKDNLPSSVKTQAKELKDLVSWSLREDGISLCLEWKDEDEALTALVKWAWQVKDGVFFLPAIHRKREYLDNYYLRVSVHKGLLNTFFQFGTTVKKDNNETKIEKFDESQIFSVSYRAIASDAKLPQYKKSTFRKGINCKSFSSPVKSWIYPGSEPRFNNSPLNIKKENNWRSIPRFSFLMLFTPLVCRYIQLPRTKAEKGMSENWAFIIPEIPTLASFQRCFIRCLTNHSNWPFNESVAGLEDAVLRYTSSTNLRAFVQRGESTNVQIVVMGKAGYYSKQQKTRKNSLRIRLSPSIRSRYTVFDRLYPVTDAIRKKRQDAEERNGERENRYIRLPSSRERITANILADVPWYSKLAFVPFWQRDQMVEECKKNPDNISPERHWFSKLRQFERRQLMELGKEEGMWDSLEEKRLLEILRDRVLRRFLNEEEWAFKSRGGSRTLPDRWDDVIAHWQRRFMRAKTRPLFRAVIHEFLISAQRRTRRWDAAKKQEARIGGTVFPAAKDDKAFHAWFWREVNDPHGWQRVRDLALLALITFSDGRLATNRD